MKIPRKPDLAVAVEMRRFRFERQWTLKRMAAYLGISLGTTYKLEHGLSATHERIRYRVRAALGMEIENNFSKKPDEISK